MIGFLIYPPIFTAAAKSGYINPLVKIEMGARSDSEPSLEIAIQPLITDAFPELFPNNRVTVRASSPQRTFWEKIMLLHEETFRPTDKKRGAYMARHYYDIYRLLQTRIAAEAAEDLKLFRMIANHRELYFKQRWVDYSTLIPGRLRIIPPDEHLSDWKSDYAAMETDMFYGAIPSFDDILQDVAKFQDDFNREHSQS